MARTKSATGFKLDHLEKWMQEVIQHPEGARAGSRSACVQRSAWSWSHSSGLDTARGAAGADPDPAGARAAIISAHPYRVHQTPACSNPLRHSAPDIRGLLDRDQVADELPALAVAVARDGVAGSAW